MDFTKSHEWGIDTTPETDLANVAEEEDEDRPGLPTRQSGSRSETDKMIIKVEVSFSREHFLLFFVRPGTTHHSANNFLMLLIVPVWSLSLQSTSIDTVITLPQDVNEAIERPLNFLGRDRLVFIDKSFWVCTWHADFRHTSNFVVGSTDSEAFEDDEGTRKLSVATTLLERQTIEPNKLVRHFFLPQDWINADVLRLCQVTPDGLFLCPRKGEVAVINSELGSGW